MFVVQSENITCHWKFFTHCTSLQLIYYNTSASLTYSYYMYFFTLHSIHILYLRILSARLEFYFEIRKQVLLTKIMFEHLVKKNIE